jgi:hypothetical protein
VATTPEKVTFFEGVATPQKKSLFLDWAAVAEKVRKK